MTRPRVGGANRSGGILDQPRSVWAVAFACVIAFMGLGLVDPILPSLARDLRATPSQVELLFSSYTLCMGVAMLVTSAVSSWIGPKRTLLAGLILIVVFSGLAGSSGSIGEIVGFRAGWGLGNALFVATALAVIVGAASGGIGSAVILYEAAIGVGIATGPLLGGVLGGISWRGPFFGVTVLMALGLLATAVSLPQTPRPARRVSILEPLRAVRDPGLLTMAMTALFYNFGFFTLLAYTPFPIGLDAHGLGLVFFGWGLGVALTSVLVAPRLQARFGTLRTTCVVLSAIGVILLVGGVFTGSRPVLIADVIVSGLFLGVNNTLVTQAVMKVSRVERPVASAGYSFVRFIGGAIAPYTAGRLGEAFSPHVPFFVGAVAVFVAVGVLFAGRRFLGAVDAPEAAHAAPAAAGPGVLLLAVDGTGRAAAVASQTARLARDRGLGVRILHVQETDVLPEDVVELETPSRAGVTLAEWMEHLRRAGVVATGEVVPSVGGHAEVGRVIVEKATDADAAVIVLGASSGGPVAHAIGGSVVGEVRRHASAEVVVLEG